MYTIILAGGLGKRMNSDIPKVLHKVDRIPMICHVIQEAMKLNTKEIMIVVGRYKETIKNTVKSFCSKQEDKKITYIVQEDKTIDGQIKTMGTGDAIRCCVPHLRDLRVNGNESVIILSGDVPLIKHSTIELLLKEKNTILTTILREPFGRGRIITNKYNEIAKIVEEKDCNEEEYKCKKVNCGIYHLNIDTIIQCVPLITNNNKSNEYYLTDIVEIAGTHNIPIYPTLLPLQSTNEILNVNTLNDLEIANKRS
jgi:bifunctional N-acetylglucosamine-1-phosphate-uridyltransferase/glucosamine-1-phosphate-acetyltransferase GlmU-like protein